ncbi:MAG: hypothetical protein AB2989_01855 [Candidatus Symbiodolus clandestinus]
MVNKSLIILLFGLLSLLPPSVGGDNLPNESTTLADLTALQQQIVRLKISLEQLKLQQELSKLDPLANHPHHFCQFNTAGLGSLTLTTLYSLAGQNFALLTYHPQTVLEVIAGDHLLCGEIIHNITDNHVEIEKQGQRYQLLGAGIPSSPPPYHTSRLPGQAR